MDRVSVIANIRYKVAGDVEWSTNGTVLDTLSMYLVKAVRNNPRVNGG